VVKDGEILPIVTIKSTGKREYSYFTYGLDAPREVLFSADYQALKYFLKVLS
jgi:hypothetical protein